LGLAVGWESGLMSGLQQQGASMNTDHLDGVLDQFTLEQRKAAVDELGRLLDAAVQPNGMELLAAFLNDLHDERLSWYGEPDEAGRARCCPDAEPCPDAPSITDTLIVAEQGQPEVPEATSPYWLDRSHHPIRAHDDHPWFHR
jgi:hypothetical protein